MKIFFSIVIGLGVLLATLLFVACSMCAFASGLPASDRTIPVTIALVCASVMVGGVYAIARLNKKDSPAE